MANEQAVQTLIRLRGVVGAGAWVAPRLSGRLFGLDVAGNPQAPYLGRLFGVRDVALAFGLASSAGPERAQWLRVGIACDLADAAAGLLAARRGELPKLATVLVTTTALAAAGLGAAALQGEQQPPTAAA
ncbi:MAG TPA: hypothetical protein VGL51_08860 [Solirubrobacteraceae bacterium]|jgi:hypothetical protein